MAKTIGIFEREHHALDAARRLKAAGFGAEGVRVIVKNEETAPLLSAQSEVTVEGVAGWRESAERRAREEGEGSEEGWFIPSAAVLLSLQGAGTPGQLAPVAALDFADVGRDIASSRLVAAIGLPESAAASCAEALNAGRFVVVAEAEAGREAASLMRETGALDVLQ